MGYDTILTERFKKCSFLVKIKTLKIHISVTIRGRNKILICLCGQIIAVSCRSDLCYGY